jgi:hypothetical protein
VVAAGTGGVFRAAPVSCAERFPQEEVDAVPEAITVAVRGGAGCSSHRCGLSNALSGRARCWVTTVVCTLQVAAAFLGCVRGGLAW